MLQEEELYDPMLFCFSKEDVRKHTGLKLHHRLSLKFLVWWMHPVMIQNRQIFHSPYTDHTFSLSLPLPALAHSSRQAVTLHLLAGSSEP